MMIRWLFILGFIGLGAQACQSSAHYIHVTYERLHGVAAEDRVLFEQNEAGSVTGVQYTPDGTYVLKLMINKGFVDAITEYTQFHIIDDPGRDGRKAVAIRLSRPDGNVLANGATVQGVTPAETLSGQIQKNIAAGFDYIESQIERFGRDVQKIPESDEYKTLRESLEALADDMLRAEKEARTRAKEEWLPKLERHLDLLREKLRQLGRENELKPLDERVEKIRRI